MSVPTKLVAFAAALAVLFAGATIAGDAIDPKNRGDQVAGLEVAGDRFPAGRATALRLRIATRDGSAVRDFDVAHTKRMHLIVVRRDLTGFQHLHPTMAVDGTWSTPVRFAAAGTYRVFADFERAGKKQTLSSDVSVPGAFEPTRLPAAADHATTADGYEVSLSAQGGETVFTVRKEGRRVTDIQPYLGARGHLVALREGDLEYLHVHPTSDATVGRDIRFMVDYPSGGRHRLFLQFRHRGRVHTAAFTQAAAPDTTEGTHASGH